MSVCHQDPARRAGRGETSMTPKCRWLGAHIGLRRRRIHTARKKPSRVQLGSLPPIVPLASGSFVTGLRASLLHSSSYSIARPCGAAAWQRPHPYVGSHGAAAPQQYGCWNAGAALPIPIALEPPPSSRNPSLAPRSAKNCNIRGCEMRSAIAKNRSFLGWSINRRSRV
jgi:hypothetical protein